MTTGTTGTFGSRRSLRQRRRPCSAICIWRPLTRYFDASEYRLIPQGDALLVAQKQDGSGVIRIGPDNTMGPMTTLLPAGMLFSAAEVDYAVSDTTGVALIKRESGHDGDPTNVYKASFDPVTLAAAVTPFSTDPYVSLRFISNDGAAYSVR